MSQENLKNTLRKWCDENLTHGRAYPGLRYNEVVKPNTLQEGVCDTRGGSLIYQDGTACSAGHVYHDVYLLDDGTYQVYTDGSQAHYTGAVPESFDVPSSNCKDILELVMYLVTHDGWDPNSCREMHQSIKGYLKVCQDPEFESFFPNSENENAILKTAQTCKQQKKKFLIDLTTCTDIDNNIIKCISDRNSMYKEHWWVKKQNPFSSI
jgi:hypothetical protein